MFFLKYLCLGGLTSKNPNPVLLEITLTSWILALSASFVLGISKAGLKGIAMVTVTLMALAFGARESTGLIVPLLLVGDVFAVFYYTRHTRWQHILRFAPWMVTGILMGTFLGKDLPGGAFKVWMVVIILVSVVVMYWWDLRKSKRVPKHWAFAGGMGIVAGLATMLGNLAGAFTNLYFLAMRLPKNEFIGTAAWLFMITNLVKL
ncbi:MAG: sulfite exporter TauE/SafE family protein, partial [Eudoraea sp.]|nr:sulfite exporter TauE/SafE family protein [Eudoraea sp.]